MTFENVTVDVAENGSNEPEAASGGHHPVGRRWRPRLSTCTLQSSVDQEVLDLNRSNRHARRRWQHAWRRHSVALDAGHSIVYVLDWSIDTTVGNDIQSDAATIDITFHLTQA